MRRACGTLLFLVVACGRPVIPLAEDENALIECTDPKAGIDEVELTEEEAADLGFPRWFLHGRPSELDAGQRAAVLSAAQSWSHENCYLPCKEQMCGEVFSSRLPGHVSVYLRYDGISRADDLIFSPEALLLVDLESPAAVVDSLVWHSGCAEACNE